MMEDINLCVKSKIKISEIDGTMILDVPWFSVTFSNIFLTELEKEKVAPMKPKTRSTNVSPMMLSREGELTNQIIYLQPSTLIIQTSNSQLNKAPLNSLTQT